MADDTHPAVLSLVTFRSSLAPEELERRYKERLPLFQELPGLLQKYYLQGPAPDVWGGLYLWDSQESLDAYMTSELRRTIPDAYEIVEAPRIETIEVIDVLRPERGLG